MNIFSGLFRSRDKPKGSIGGVGGGFRFNMGGTSSGKTVTERSAMQTTAVYSCVKVISEAVASLPLHVYEEKPNGDTEKATRHALYTLLHLAPNVEMTAYTFIETALTHLLLWGNFYAQIVRDGRGFPIGLYPLLPNLMDISRDNSTKEIVYTYRSDGGEIKLSRYSILHIPGLGFDGVVGYSPIALAKNSIGMAIATEEYGAAFFKNGANPGGVLEFPGTVKDVARVKENWNTGYRGSDNAHKIALLEEGAKLNPISIPPEQAQFIQTRRYELEEIARVFRVPLHLVGDLEHATFSNIEFQSMNFVKFTLIPWIRRLELGFEKSLLPPWEQSSVFIKFSVDGLLRGAYKERMEGYAIGIQNGIYSINEVRALENMNLLSDGEGGNLHILNGNAIKLADAGAAYGLNKKQEGSYEDKK
ncbi:portal protein [Clostridia bacterium]|nr:portal protein [Clostridia bacterium]